MSDWFKDRLKEKTTYRGLALLLAAGGVVVDPMALEVIAAGVLALCGVIETVSKEAEAV